MKSREELGDIRGKTGSGRYYNRSGLTFAYQGIQYFIGNRKLFGVNGINVEEQEEHLQKEEEQGQTAVLIGNEEKVLGLFPLRMW